MQSALANITTTQVAGLLKNFSENLSSVPEERWKETIRPLVDKIVLDPETLDCCIHYRFAVDDRLCMASPRECDAIPVLPAMTQLIDHIKKITSRSRSSRT